MIICLANTCELALSEWLVSWLISAMSSVGEDSEWPQISRLPRNRLFRAQVRRPGISMRLAWVTHSRCGKFRASRARHLTCASEMVMHPCVLWTETVIKTHTCALFLPERKTNTRRRGWSVLRVSCSSTLLQVIAYHFTQMPIFHNSGSGYIILLYLCCVTIRRKPCVFSV